MIETSLGLLLPCCHIVVCKAGSICTYENTPYMETTPELVFISPLKLKSSFGLSQRHLSLIYSTLDKYQTCRHAYPEFSIKKCFPEWSRHILFFSTFEEFQPRDVCFPWVWHLGSRRGRAPGTGRVWGPVKNGSWPYRLPGSSTTFKWSCKYDKYDK